MLRISLLVASAAAADAWAGQRAYSGSPASSLRLSACSREAAASTVQLPMLTQDRRSFLTAASGLAAGLVLPGNAFAATVDKDFSANIVNSALQATVQVVGGSTADFETMKGSGALAPGASLEGFDLTFYEVVKYAAIKAPVTEDPRAGLRGVIGLRIGDALYKLATDNGISPKLYDARGDGLSNGGKGGVIKGIKTLCDGLAKKGLLDQVTVDTTGYDEAKWQQANPMSLSVMLKNPAGAAAASQLEKDQVGLEIDIVSAVIAGYLKVVATTKKTVTPEGTTVKLDLAWAGRARQKATMERRANDKLNAARQFSQ